MDTKILISILIAISLIVGIGFVVAHGTDTNDNDASYNMEEMSEMMDMMDESGMMGMMMENMDEMHEQMEEMMSDEGMREEMLEHMKNCPMMKRFGSS